MDFCWLHRLQFPVACSTYEKHGFEKQSTAPSPSYISLPITYMSRKRFTISRDWIPIRWTPGGEARRWSSPLLSVPIAQVKNWRMFFHLLADVRKEGYISQWVMCLPHWSSAMHLVNMALTSVSGPLPFLAGLCLTSLQLPPYVHLSNFHLQVGLSGKWEERNKCDHKPCSEESDQHQKDTCYNALGSKYRHLSRFSC